MNKPMKPLLLTIALLLGSVSVSNTEELEKYVKIPKDFERYAEIQNLTDEDGTKVKVYVDILSPKKEGSEVYYWKVLDYQEPKIVAGKSVFSVKLFTLSDCLKTSVKHIQLLYFSQNMGKGKMLQRVNREEEWIYYPPQSWGATVINFACETGDIITNSNRKLLE